MLCVDRVSVAYKICSYVQWKCIIRNHTVLIINQLDALISQIYFWNETTYFGQFLCPSSGVCHYTHSSGICRTACEQDQDGVPSWSCSQAVWRMPLLCVQWKTTNDGKRDCPKHVEFYSKNKFEKLVLLFGFIIRMNFVGCLCIMGMINAQKIDALILFASCQQNLYVLLCVQWKTADDGQRNCPKYVEFHSKMRN